MRISEKLSGIFDLLNTSERLKDLGSNPLWCSTPLSLYDQPYTGFDSDFQDCKVLRLKGPRHFPRDWARTPGSNIASTLSPPSALYRLDPLQKSFGLFRLKPSKKLKKVPQALSAPGSKG